MQIVLSNDARLPLTIQSGFQVKHYTINEFKEAAEKDEINVDEALWVNVSDIDIFLYGVILDAFKNNVSEGQQQAIQLYFYKFSDQPEPNFQVTQPVEIYDAAPQYTKEPEDIPTVPEVPEDENIQESIETPIEQPQVEEPDPQPYQAPDTVQEVVMPETPVESTPVSVADLEENQAKNDLDVIEQFAKGEVVDQQPVNLSDSNTKRDFKNLLIAEPDDTRKRKPVPAKVILFGSSKGGTGKTITCMMSAYEYAKTHPNQRIALADFDIIDGQIAISLNKVSPTLQDFYKVYKAGKRDFSHLENCRAKSDKFSPNIDFYFAPTIDIPTITNNMDFWYTVLELLIKNYDVVFFDSGIDYLGKAPISMLYKIASKIIITSNTTINSVKSIITQLKTLSGTGNRKNNVFQEADNILAKTNVVLTRVSNFDNKINNIIAESIADFVPIIAAFGNIDNVITRLQWYQEWYLIDSNPDIVQNLNRITELTDEDS